MFLRPFCESLCRLGSRNPLQVIAEAGEEVRGPSGFEGSELGADDDSIDFDPSCREIDVLGDFGLDDELPEPELGDFWMDALDQWD